jgi:hypothetical protein
MKKLKTFREWLAQRDGTLIAEADELKQLRNTLIDAMDLADVINSKTGEDISLEQLDLDDIKERLTRQMVWKRLPDTSKDATEGIFREPGNKRLGDLLDAMCQQPIDLGKQPVQDDQPSPQKPVKPNAEPPQPTLQ